MAWLDTFLDMAGVCILRVFDGDEVIDATTNAVKIARKFGGVS